jgi:hypothetical protein
MLAIETARVFEPLLKPSRYKGAWGGRGSGKSHFMAGAVVCWPLRDCATALVPKQEARFPGLLYRVATLGTQRAYALLALS